MVDCEFSNKAFYCLRRHVSDSPTTRSKAKHGNMSLHTSTRSPPDSFYQLRYASPEALIEICKTLSPITVSSPRSFDMAGHCIASFSRPPQAYPTSCLGSSISLLSSSLCLSPPTPLFCAHRLHLSVIPPSVCTFSAEVCDSGVRPGQAENRTNRSLGRETSFLIGVSKIIQGLPTNSFESQGSLRPACGVATCVV